MSGMGAVSPACAQTQRLESQDVLQVLWSEHSLSSRVLREARPDSSNLRSEDKQPSSTHHKLQYYPIMMR